AAAADVPEIEEERHLRIVLADGPADPLEEIDLRRLGEFYAITRARPVEPIGLHRGLRPGADRNERETDIDEDAVGVRKELHRLFALAAEIVEIGRGEIEKRPARAERLAALADEHALRRHHPPAGMLAGGELVPAGGKIDRRIDSGAVKRVDL